ncbi:MAG TPA: hypothetical protein VE843_09850, partial [Ktedonobacteraceae bacterium]|nr:hypothetical protein [Ktedonobacteraceae bacterium]
MTHPPAFRRHMRKNLLATTAALLVMVLLSACNGDPQTQQQANQYKADLDQALSQAQSIGVPDSMLQPIRQQEVQLSQTKAPLSLFSDQNVTDYYADLARRYQVLSVQVRGLISQATQQFDYQATLNLQDLASILSRRQAQGFVEAKTFADQLKQYQNLMAQAQYPKDYLQIIKDATSTMQALHLMGSTYDSLTALHLTIRQLQSSHLDVTALQQEEQYDLQLFRSANVPERFVQLDDLINTQLDETVAFSAQAIPYVGAAKLSQLSSEIATLKQYGQDTSAFQKRLNADQTALNQARMMGDFLKVSSQIDNDVAAIQLPLVQGQANYLLKQFHREVTNWGSTHQYHDSYDNTSYPLDYEYDQQEGFGSDADVAVQTAQTLDDYQAAINTINDDMTNLKAMEAD